MHVSTRILAVTSRAATFLIVPIAVVGWGTSSSNAQWKQMGERIPAFQSSLTWGGALEYKDGVIWGGKNGLVFSTDQGKSWTECSTGAGVINDISFLNSRKGIVTGTNGLFLTLDRGNSWKAIEVSGSPSNYYSAVLAGSEYDIVASVVGGVIVSHDGGATWTKTHLTGFATRLQFHNGVVYVACGSLADHAHLYSSSDRGRTWQQKAGLIDFDTWSIGVGGCDDQHVYAVNEDYASPTDALAEIYVSSDGGESWVAEYSAREPYLAGSVTVQADAVYAQTLYNGVIRGTHDGTVWKLIGGPTNVPDSRMICSVDNNTVIAADEDGSVFITRNGGGDSVVPRSHGVNDAVIFPAMTAKVSSSTCATLDTAVYFSFVSCEPGAAKLVGVSLTGSGTFEVLDSVSAPRTITEFDSVGIRYNGIPGIIDTARLRISFTINSVGHDTTMLLIGENANLFTANSVSQGTVKSAPDAWITLPILAQLPSSYDIYGHEVTSVAFAIEYNSNLIDMPASKLAQLLTPPAGWRIKSASISANTLSAEITNNAHHPTPTLLDLGSARFATFQDSERSTIVRLSKLDVTLDSTTTHFCLGGEGDYIANVVVGASSVAVAPNPESVVRVFPQPVRFGAMIHCTVTLNGESEVGLALFDLLGRERTRRSLGTLSLGEHSFDFDSRALAEGTYYLRCSIDGTVITRKIVVE